MCLKLTALEELIMLTIRHEPKYGLQIMDEYEQLGEYIPKPLMIFRRHLASGNLYPTLRKLRQKGLIRVENVEYGSQERQHHGQVYYKVTQNGEFALQFLENARGHLGSVGDGGYSLP